MTRRRSAVGAFVAWAVVALALGGCAHSGRERSSTTTPPTASGATPTTLASGPQGGDDEGLPAGAPRVGLSPSLAVFGQSDAALADTMDRIAATGAGWLRVDVDWSYVQRRGPDDWDFAVADRVIEAARVRSIRVIGLLTYTPEWARPPDTPDKHPPLDPAAFARFATAAVARYAPMGVQAWEIWNEPNIAAFWAPQPDPEAYARLLVTAAGAIRSEQPEATIISGGLAPAVDRSDHSMVAPVSFLRRMFDAGAGDSFDAVGLHPYSFPDAPLAPSEANAFALTPAVHQVLVDAGHGDRRIWGTEIGAPTAGGANALSPAGQAALLTDAYRQWLDWPFTGPLLWYAWIDEGTDPADVQDHFGLVDTLGVAKPALDAFRAAAASDLAHGSGFGGGGEHDAKARTAEG